MKLAIIIARGGSKRIPRKNIRQFCGKPIIAYSIEAAIKSSCFDEVMVSTDDEEIAEIARSYGANVPFLRASKTSTDHATTADVILEVLKEYQKNNNFPAFACCIYPTAPLIKMDDLISAFNLLSNNEKATAVIPVVLFSYPIQRALSFDSGSGFLSMSQSQHIKARSQDLTPFYHDAGQFYWLRVSSFLESPELLGLGGKTIGLILPERQVQDIDNEEDWALAEMKYQLMRAENPNTNHS